MLIMDSNVGDCASIPDNSLPKKVRRKRVEVFWRVSELDNICPRGVQDFIPVYSPIFTTGKVFGKTLNLQLSISGHRGYLSVYLSQPLPNEDIITGSIELSLQNANGPALRGVKVEKFTLDSENCRSCIWPKFVSIENLWVDRKKLLFGNGLEFIAVIRFDCDPEDEVNETISKPSPGRPCLKKFNKIEEKAHGDFFKNMEFLEINCESTIFKVNFPVLAAKSGYFADLLRNGTIVDNHVELPGNVDAETFGLIVDFMYIGEVPINLEISDAEKLLKAAEDYDIVNLADSVLRILCQDIGVENFQQLSFLCQKYNGSQEIQNLLSKFGRK